MTTITSTIRFDKYVFSRVKPYSKSAICYTPTDWVGKQVLIIPVSWQVSDKTIEHSKLEDGTYEFTTHTGEMFIKTISKGSNVGRAYLHQDYIGADVLIVEAPQIDTT